MSMGMARTSRAARGAEHEVLVSHPERGEARPARLSFTSRGVLLRPGLLVPWWAVEGFTTDAAATPSGAARGLRVVELATAAGALELLCAAADVDAVLADLAVWAGRWRWERRPAVRHACRAGAILAATAARARAGLLARLPRSVAAPVSRRTAAVAAVALVVVMAAVGVSGGAGGGPALTASSTDVAVSPGFDASGMSQILGAAGFGAGTTVHLARATAPPPPAPPSLADEPPLRPHEVFGFAPYWSLGQATGYDLSGYTTIAYFALGVNADGTLQESGPGWDGYESQDFANLVARAHAEGTRVVLTVSCFSQASLDELSSSATAAATLAAAVAAAVAAKNLDGVNIDFEGQGPADQAGLTRLVTAVSSVLHAADPHDQVTIDTYASSAGDPAGFYDVPALAPVVDGFFVMAYDLNLSAAPSAESPITSAALSDAEAAAQYAAAVPPSKVVLGSSFFAYTWPTTNGTMAATPTGAAVPETDAQVFASGRPAYWDPVTDTAWTSYEVGDQWYETYYEDPASLYLVAQLAEQEGFAGVGAWALGMDGNDPQMTAALDGGAPPAWTTSTGPASTSQSGPPPAVVAARPAPPPRAAGGAAGNPASPHGSSPPSTSSTTGGAPGAGGPGGASGAVSGAGSGAGGSGGAPGAGGSGAGSGAGSGGASGGTPGSASGGGSTARYAGVFDGQSVPLTLLSSPPAGATLRPAGTLTGFATTDPALSCLASAPSLTVSLDVTAGIYLVVASEPGDCADAEFSFAPTTTTTAPSPPPPGG
jgi:spore germination protein YaaH